MVRTMGAGAQQQFQSRRQTGIPVWGGVPHLCRARILHGQLLCLKANKPEGKTKHMYWGTITSRQAVPITTLAHWFSYLPDLPLSSLGTWRPSGQTHSWVAYVYSPAFWHRLT